VIIKGFGFKNLKYVAVGKIIKKTIQNKANLIKYIGYVNNTKVRGHKNYGLT